jgi:hypothetical protein
VLLAAKIPWHSSPHRASALRLCTRASQRPNRHQPVDLDLRTQMAQNGAAADPVGCDALLRAEEPDEDVGTMQCPSGASPASRARDRKRARLPRRLSSHPSRHPRRPGSQTRRARLVGAPLVGSREAPWRPPRRPALARLASSCGSFQAICPTPA